MQHYSTRRNRSVATRTHSSIVGAVLIGSLLIAHPASGQNRFETLPGYDRYQETQQLTRQFFRTGRVSEIRWSDDASRLTFSRDDSFFAYDRSADAVGPIDKADAENGSNARDSRFGSARRGGGVARGRQRAEEKSPDGAWVAKHADHNLRIENADGSEVIPVTTDGNDTLRYATGSWVYGEELRQNSAMWWSPDSTMIAFYEFNNEGVQPYYLVRGLTEVQSELYPEHYPKAGAQNPVVGLLVYNLESRELVRIDVGDDAEQYIYNVEWSPDGTELLFNQTNRHQNVLNVMAADPATGATRLIVREEQETWQQNAPEMRFLDEHRFIWETERTGWKHYELRHLDGSMINPLTTGEYPCDSIVLIDEDAGWMYYTAYSADTPLHQQLHRVRLDGTGESRLTSEDLNYSDFAIAPDHSAFVAVTQSIETPPSTAVFDMSGNRLETIAEADTSDLSGRPQPEMFTFKADDGATDLYGVLFKPSNFDPAKQYPLLIEVYGGPWSQTVRARYSPAHPACEFGFIIAQIDNRGTPNRGKRFEDAAYLKLGIVDMKDQADGATFLAQREYIDGNRVGITGHSYGGYMSALAVLKHPDVFHVAVAGAAVTDWRNYDTIYTERFMRTPLENPEGYKDGSCLTYADQLKGKLLLQHGMVDDNVHPANFFQLIHEFQKNRIPFDLMVYPTSGHGFATPSANPLKWEYLYDHLIDDAG